MVSPVSCSQGMRPSLVFVRAQVGCPFNICLGALSRNWCKMSEFMFDKSRSKEGGSSRNLRELCTQALDQPSPFLVLVGDLGCSC